MASRLDRIRALVEANPGDPFGWYSLAMEQWKSDRGEARRLFEKLLAEHPGYVPTYYQLGKLLLEVDLGAEAAAVLTRGLDAAGRAGDGHAAGEIAALLDSLK
jgi:tetratricopeptide (TPR) repeat protein